MRETKLHEILAVDRDRQNAAKTLLEESKTTFQKKGHLFRGSTKTTSYLDAERQGENTEESSTVSDTVQGNLDYLATFVGAHWDTLLTKETGNTAAFADLELDGVVVAESVPGTFLLGMESRLHELRTVYLSIPTLDPAYEWSPAPEAGGGVFRSKVPTKFKTEKYKDFKVVVPATPQHPAQVDATVMDRNVARIEEVAFSGMVTPQRKADMIARIDKLIAAVKQARQRANETVVEQRKIAKSLFDFIHG